MPRRYLCLIALAAGCLFPATAWAGRYDLDLTPLSSVSDDGVVTPDNEAFRSLASELGSVVAPRPVDPADSLGLSGFAVAADVGINTISSNANYWEQTANSAPNSVVPTVQVLGRKGLWPGIEIGAGGTKVLDSKMWTIAGYGKLALHEGFHHLPIPSIALRGMFSRLLGSKDIDMTTASIGVAISHVFGLGSTFNITPYAGYQTLFVIARTGVVDATPEQDEYLDGQVPCANGDPECFVEGEFVFRQQDVIVRHRPYIGARFIFSVIRLAVEYMPTIRGRTGATVDLDGGGSQDVTDQSGTQHHVSISVGLDF